jgi:outer membrane protease
MRNITVFAVLVIILNGVSFADETPAASYALSSWTSFGTFLGQAEEIVYPPSEYKAEKLSQLLWDILPVFYYGFSLDFSPVQPWEKWGFFATLSLKNGIPGRSGRMEDRDWASIQNAALTHYSVHNNYTNTLFFLDLSAGLSLPFNQLLLKTYLTLSYMYFSFTGQYGHGTYPGENVSFADWEKVINYTQSWLTVAPGVSLGYYFNRFFAEVFFNISPLISCDDVDEHLYTDVPPPSRPDNAIYKDYMRGGIFLEPGFHFSFIASRQLEFAFDFSWRYMGGTKGQTWSGRPIGTANMTQNGKAGAGLSLFNIGLCMKIRLPLKEKAEEKAAGLNR